MTPILHEPPPAAVYSRLVTSHEPTTTPSTVFSQGTARSVTLRNALLAELPRIKAFPAQFEASLRAPASKKKQLREQLAQQIRASAVPIAYLQVVMRKCADVHSPDALDFSIDLLAGFSDQLEALCRGFIEADQQRWPIQPQQSHANDDICYVLLRALGRSQVDIAAKLAVIEDCLTNGPRGVREAAVHALGDVGGAEAERLLRVFAKEDVDCLVRESAETLLSEWEN